MRIPKWIGIRVRFSIRDISFYLCITVVSWFVLRLLIKEADLVYISNGRRYRIALPEEDAIHLVIDQTGDQSGQLFSLMFIDYVSDVKYGQEFVRIPHIEGNTGLRQAKCFYILPKQIEFPPLVVITYKTANIVVSIGVFHSNKRKRVFVANVSVENETVKYLNTSELSWFETYGTDSVAIGKRLCLCIQEL